jgi:hypothetical protein
MTTKKEGNMPATKTLHILTRDEILAAKDHKIEPIEVPEWGGSGFVKSLSGTDRDRLESAGIVWEKRPNGTIAIGGYKAEGTRARLVAASFCDADGNLLFAPADIEALGAKDSAPLNRIADVATRLSGMAPAAIEEAKVDLKAEGNG